MELGVHAEVTPHAYDRRYRIAFRDVSAEPVLQRWARDEATFEGSPCILSKYPKVTGRSGSKTHQTPRTQESVY